MLTHEQFLRELDECGLPITEIAKLAYVAHRTIYRWRESKSTFERNKSGRILVEMAFNKIKTKKEKEKASKWCLNPKKKKG